MVPWPLKITYECHHYLIMSLNTLRPRQDGRHFADAIFTCIFFNENCCILIKFSLKYVRKGPIDNNPALVQIMAWCPSGDKPLSKPMMISLSTHICITRPQWVKMKLVNGIILSMRKYGLVSIQSFYDPLGFFVYWCRSILTLLMLEMEYSNFGGQYHACWCPGS